MDDSDVRGVIWGIASLALLNFLGCSQSTGMNEPNGGVAVTIFEKQSVSQGSSNSTSVAAAFTPPIDCTALGIGVMTVQVIDTNGTVRGGQDFNCADHQGTVNGVPSGDGYTVRVIGRPYKNGPNVWQGQVAGVSVAPNSVAQASVGIDRTFDGLAFRYLPCNPLPASCTITLQINETRQLQDVLATLAQSPTTLVAPINPANIAFSSSDPGVVLIERSGRITGISQGGPITLTANYPAGATTTNNSVTVNVTSGQSPGTAVLGSAPVQLGGIGTASVVQQNGNPAIFVLEARQVTAQPILTLSHTCASIPGLTCDFLSIATDTAITQITPGHPLSSSDPSLFRLRITASSAAPLGTSNIQVISSGTLTLNLAINVVGAPGTQPGGVSKPFIASLAPSEQKINQLITINGGGFGTAQGNSSVTVAGAPFTSVQSWGDAQIQVLVPSTAQTGPLIVTVEQNASDPVILVVPWAQANPSNVQLVQETHSQGNTQLTTSDLGTLVVWEDSRNGVSNIFAQTISGNGTITSGTNGFPVKTSSNAQTNAKVNRNIVVWVENTDIFGARVFGNLQVGIAFAVSFVVSQTTGNQTNQQVTSDGGGGVITVWQDTRNNNSDIFAQRIDNQGQVQWMTNGVPVSIATGDQTNPQLTSDGVGGAIAAWQDGRNPRTGIFVQRIDGVGVRQWSPPDGVSVVQFQPPLLPPRQTTPQIVSDGAGGAITMWLTDEGDMHLFGQRLNSAGSLQWGSAGVRLSFLQLLGLNPFISDGAGGAIVAVKDETSLTGQIYAQRVDSNGNIQWGGPVSISTGGGGKGGEQITQDGNGGAVVVWGDGRNGNPDIYAQGITEDGLE
jgi:hypothetical protein